MVRYDWDNYDDKIIERKDGEYVTVEDVKYVLKELRKSINEGYGKTILTKFVDDILETLI